MSVRSRNRDLESADNANDWQNYDGDPRERQQARDWYDRNERRREARLAHYMEPFSGGNAYGRRAYFDPDINRSDRYPYSWREGTRFSDREQDYRGRPWHRDTHSYYDGYGGHPMPSTWRGDLYTRGMNDPESREYGDYPGGETEQDLPGLQNFDTGYAPDYDNRFGRGGFAGIAPKNYQRSDERIQEDVCEQLTAHPEIDPSNVEIKVVQGEVTLAGEVPARRMKRMIEAVAENVPGVRDINNQLRVAQQAEPRVGYRVSSQHHASNGQHRPN